MRFPLSLAVKDLEASRQFCQMFGFKAAGGDPSQNWLILKNSDHAIGLFERMFGKNIVIFNPGWDYKADRLAAFTEVHELHRQLANEGERRW